MATIFQLTPAYEPQIGGVETHVREINRLLVKLGHTVTVVCLQGEANLLEETIDGVRVLRIPVPLKKSKFFLQRWLDKLREKLGVWWWIFKHGPILIAADIIQIHDVFWWIWPIYQLTYYKVYLTFHGWEGKYPVPWRIKLHRYYNHLAAKKTLHVGAYLQQFYWDKPSAVIYGGVTPALIDLRGSFSHHQGKLLSNESKIVLVGRLEKVNEIEKYLAFVRYLKEIYPKINFTFVGDGSWRTECEKFGQVTGFIADPSRHLLAADLVCASSYLSILEAQALGKLVCAFYSNPLKKSYLETHPGAKYLLIESDPALLAKKVQVLTAAGVEKLATKIKIAATTQTWEKVLAVYLKIWNLA